MFFHSLMTIFCCKFGTRIRSLEQLMLSLVVFQSNYQESWKAFMIIHFGKISMERRSIILRKQPNKWTKILNLHPDGKEEFWCRLKDESQDNNDSWFRRFHQILFKVPMLSTGLPRISITKLSLISVWESPFQNHINSEWVSKWQVNNGCLIQQRTRKKVSKVGLTCTVNVKLLILSFLTIKLNK